MKSIVNEGPERRTLTVAPKNMAFLLQNWAEMPNTSSIVGYASKSLTIAQYISVEPKEKDIMTNDRLNTAALGVLAGTALGVTLGILFAPDKGSNTRQKISDQTSNAADNITRNAGELRERVVQSFQSDKSRIEDKVDHLLSESEDKTEEVIGALENKLKELKAKGKKLKSA